MENEKNETFVYIDDEDQSASTDTIETVAVESTDDEAAKIAASQATNAKHVAVAEATIAQAVPDSQVSLLQELEDLAEDIGGIRQEQILAISMRMRAVLASV